MSQSQELTGWLNPNTTSIDDLFSALGRTSPQSNAFGDDLVKQGRTILLGLRAQLVRHICGNERIMKHPAIAGSSQANDTLALAAVVAAEIPPNVGTGINKFLIAALLVRVGLRRFCEGTADRDA